MSLRINSEAPNFTAETTKGTIDFHQWTGGRSCSLTRRISRRSARLRLGWPNPGAAGAAAAQLLEFINLANEKECAAPTMISRDSTKIVNALLLFASAIVVLAIAWAESRLRTEDVSGPVSRLIGRDSRTYTYNGLRPDAELVVYFGFTTCWPAHSTELSAIVQAVAAPGSASDLIKPDRPAAAIGTVVDSALERHRDDVQRVIVSPQSVSTSVFAATRSAVPKPSVNRA
jgi:hypothetical protein